MKKSLILLLFTALSFLLLPACKQGPGNDAVNLRNDKVALQLEENWDAFLAAFSQGDLDRAMSFYTEDYINMPGPGVTQNFDETRDLFQGMVDEFYFESSVFRQTEVFVHPGMAYEFGEIYMVMVNRNDGDTVINDPRCLTVWKQVEDGSWKFHRWLGQ